MVRKYDYTEAENTNTHGHNVKHSQSRFQYNSIQHDLKSHCQCQWPCQRLQTGTGAAGLVLEITQPGTTTVVSSTPKGTQMWSGKCEVQICSVITNKCLYLWPLKCPHEWRRSVFFQNWLVRLYDGSAWAKFCCSKLCVIHSSDAFSIKCNLNTRELPN